MRRVPHCMPRRRVARDSCLPAHDFFFTGRCIIRIKIGMASCISCHYKSGDVQSLLLLQGRFCFKFVCCSHSHFQDVRSIDTRCSFGVADFLICLDSSTSWQMMQGKYSVSRLFLIVSVFLHGPALFVFPFQKYEATCVVLYGDWEG